MKSRSLYEKAVRDMCTYPGCEDGQSGYFGSTLCHEHYYEALDSLPNWEEEDEDPTAGFIYCMDR